MSLTRDDKDMLAAEHAMGLITGEEADQAEQLLASDEEYIELYARWRERLSEIDGTATRQPPGEALWNRIASALPVAAKPQSARTPAASRSQTLRLKDLWDSLGFWRPAGLVAALAALVLATGLGLSVREIGRQPVLVAVLMTENNQPGAIVNVMADGRAELVPLSDIPVPDGRTLQIWTLWDRVRGPVSVGLAQSARRLDLELKALPRTTATQLFEITLEPVGGSPTGRPTGPVLMKGNATTAL